MTTQAKRLTLIDRLLALLERVRRRPKEPEFIDLHLHVRPSIVVHSTDGGEFPMRMVGACLKPAGLGIHFRLKAPRDFTLLRYRVTSEWQDAPPDMALGRGEDLRFTWVAVTDPEAAMKEMAALQALTEQSKPDDEGPA